MWEKITHPLSSTLRKKSLFTGKIANKHRDLFLFHFWEKRQIHFINFRWNFPVILLMPRGLGCVLIHLFRSDERLPSLLPPGDDLNPGLPVAALLPLLCLSAPTLQVWPEHLRLELLASCTILFSSCHPSSCSTSFHFTSLGVIA